MPFFGFCFAFFFLQNDIFNGIFVKQNVLHNIPKLCKNYSGQIDKKLVL